MSESTSTPVLSTGFQWAGLTAASPEQAFRMALASPAIPKFYANMFTNVVSPTEVTMLFGLHGAANTVVSVSYGVAKSLVEKLSQAIKEYEEKTGTAVLDGEGLEKAFQPK